MGLRFEEHLALALWMAIGIYFLKSSHFESISLPNSPKKTKVSVLITPEVSNPSAQNLSCWTNSWYFVCLRNFVAAGPGVKEYVETKEVAYTPYILNRKFY